MFHSYKNLGKIKLSKKPSAEKNKAPWNKGISKKKTTKTNSSTKKTSFK